MNKHVRGLIAILAVGGMLTFGLAPVASAHGAHYVPYGAYPRAYRHHAVRPIPAWVRADLAFHRWYLRSHYRHMHRLSWHRLVELYRYDTRYRAHRHRHVYTDRFGRRIHVYR